MVLKYSALMFHYMGLSNRPVIVCCERKVSNPFIQFISFMSLVWALASQIAYLYENKINFFNDINSYTYVSLAVIQIIWMYTDFIRNETLTLELLNHLEQLVSRSE